MNPVYETERRLVVARNIASSLEGIATGVILGGTMGFGQNYSVTDRSDIDTVVVTEPSRVDALMSTWYFEKGTSREAIDLFTRKAINFFWVTKVVDGVEVNAFVYDANSYADFCLLRGDLVGFNKKEPTGETANWGFDGTTIMVQRKVLPVKDGFLYTKPALIDGKYWGCVPRQDFFYSGCIVLQENSFFTDLEAKTWKATIEQLVKEHGTTPDLTKTNILNSHYTFQTNPGKLPPEVIRKIQERTKLELVAYLK